MHANFKQCQWKVLLMVFCCADKKEKKIFLKYKEIQMGAIASHI
jgi:hypothetical protein